MEQPDIEPLIAHGLALSQSMSGGRDTDDRAVIQLERLLFRSLDEDLLIEQQLEERRRQQETDRWIGRAIGAGVGLLFGGLADGFDLGDLTTGFVAGAVGSLTADGLNQLSDRELKDLGFEWAASPASFIYHRRRHGQPRQRVLVISPRGNGTSWWTAPGVRFRDGYIAFFSPLPMASDATKLNGVRCLNGAGLTPDPNHSQQVLGSWPCSDGQNRPLELVPTDDGNMLVLALPIPHHSIY